MEYMTIKVEPEDVDQHIKNAILNSAIGASLSRGISEKLRGWEFDKAVKTVIDEEVPKIIRNVMHEVGLRERIAEAVRTALTDDVVLDIASKAVSELYVRR